jgi:hypothetical protein
MDAKTHISLSQLDRDYKVSIIYIVLENGDGEKKACILI